MLTEREKFIAHYISVEIIGAISKGTNADAANKTLDKIAGARVRNLTDDEIETIIGDLSNEFLLVGSFLNGLHKKSGEHPGDDTLV